MRARTLLSLGLALGVLGLWPAAGLSQDEPDLAESTEEAPAEPAVADEADTAEPVGEAREHGHPALREPFPFDHAEHTRAFKRAGVQCLDCHPVGTVVRVERKKMLPEDLPGPRSSCHACHHVEDAVPGAPRRAPGACELCHADRSELVPADHGAMWMADHGREALVRKSTCMDCHDTHTCVACHDERGALERNPHPPGFGSFHGVEARMDPHSCTSCHTGDSCTSCHTTGALPW